MNSNNEITEKQMFIIKSTFWFLVIGEICWNQAHAGSSSFLEYIFQSISRLLIVLAGTLVILGIEVLIQKVVDKTLSWLKLKSQPKKWIKSKWFGILLYSLYIASDVYIKQISK